MCGIAAIFEEEQCAPADTHSLGAMLAGLAHRGRDGEGVWIGEGAAIGARRLAIVDRAGGGQPITDSSGRWTIAMNGEIYNHLDLRAALAASGCRFRTSSDTEVVLLAYREWGAACLAGLHGMFAFVVWDSQRRELFAARDRFGEKPLFYARDSSRGLIVASEIAAICASGRVPFTIDRTALEVYLAFGWIPSPLTVDASIRKLPPGSWLRWRPDQSMQIGQYVTPFRFDDDPARDEAQYLDELRERLSEAVCAQTMRDAGVPIGVFLSGGLDSGTIAALARDHGQPLHTFSAGVCETDHDERVYAERLAKALGTEHHAIEVTPAVLDRIPAIVRHVGEPFADSSALMLDALCAGARGTIMVALMGEGADELFGGYPRYTDRSVLEPPHALGAVSRVGQAIAARLPARMRGRQRLARWGLGARGRYWDGMMVFDDAWRRALIGARPVGVPPPLEVLHDSHEGWTRDSSSAMQTADLVHYLPDDLLVKADRVSMAHGIETRAPFLYPPLVDLIARMPFGLRGRGKIALRRAMTDRLPQETLTRAKQGFSLPVTHWMRDRDRSPARRWLDDPRAPIGDWIDMRAARHLMQEHEQGKHRTRELWTLVMLAAWAEECV